MIVRLLAAQLWIAFLAVPVAASPAAVEPAHASVVTRHVGTFGGERIAYRAVVEQTPILGQEDGPEAFLVSTAYLAENVADPDRRPVLFLFNGGPISASLYLHMGAFGPKRVAFPDDLTADPAEYRVVDNPYTLLDMADLVFIDPAGTGFSRVAEGVDPKRFHSVVADGEQVTAFINRWLRDNDRLESPQYLFGESYGTLRAAQVAMQLLDLPEPIALEGVVLFGQALNIIEFSQRPGNIISYVVSLPTLTATAWYHNQIDREGRTLDEALDDARAFAADDYLRALYQGSRIEPAEERRVASRLEALTGIPAAYYLENDLRITKEQYRRELFREEGLVLGRYDARYLAPAEGENGGDPSAVLAAALERNFQDYLRSDLGVASDQEYRTRAEVAGLEGWGWGATTPFSDWPYMRLISDVMERVPEFRLLVGVGHYDTTTTTGASEYAIAQAGWPADRVAIEYYEGGHMAYTDEESLVKLMRDMRAFLRPGRE